MSIVKSRVRLEMEAVRAKAILELAERSDTPPFDPKTPLELIKAFMACGERDAGHALIRDELRNELMIAGYSKAVSKWVKPKARAARDAVLKAELDDFNTRVDPAIRARLNAAKAQS